MILHEVTIGHAVEKQFRESWIVSISKVTAFVRSQNQPCYVANIREAGSCPGLFKKQLTPSGE